MTEDHFRRFRDAGVTQGAGDRLVDELRVHLAAFEQQHLDEMRRMAGVLYSGPNGESTTSEHAWHVTAAFGLAILFSEHVARAIATAPNGSTDVRRAIVNTMLSRACAGTADAVVIAEEETD